MNIKESEFNEVEYELVIFTKSKQSITLSKFNEVTKQIEQEFSKGDFTVSIKRLDPGEYEDSD